MARVEVDLGENGGVRRFQSWAGFARWLETEREKWDWLAGTGQHDAGNAEGKVFSAFNQLQDATRTAEANSAPLEDIRGLVEPRFTGASPQIVHSQSDLGRAVLLIKDTIGPREAAFALSAALGRVAVDALTWQQFKAVLVAAAPHALGIDKLAAALRAERGRFQRATQAAERESQTLLEDQEDRWVSLLTNSAERATTVGLRSLARWRRVRTAQRREANAAISDLRAVETAYREQMALQAPVEYWEGKAASHKTAEGKASTRLWVFFPAAAVLVVAAFGGTAWLLLTASRQPDPPIYFLLSAGLAALVGLVIWIGRLLTRLYLSEHHLRKDADERAIMTKTYLALTRDGAAEPIDRQIILSALFRNSADGIVKDDGSPDLGPAAFLARAGLPTAQRSPS